MLKACVVTKCVDKVKVKTFLLELEGGEDDGCEDKTLGPLDGS